MFCQFLFYLSFQCHQITHESFSVCLVATSLVLQRYKLCHKYRKDFSHHYQAEQPRQHTYRLPAKLPCLQLEQQASLLPVCVAQLLQPIPTSVRARLADDAELGFLIHAAALATSRSGLQMFGTEGAYDTFSGQIHLAFLFV